VVGYLLRVAFPCPARVGLRDGFAGSRQQLHHPDELMDASMDASMDDQGSRNRLAVPEKVFQLMVVPLMACRWKADLWRAAPQMVVLSKVVLSKDDLMDDLAKDDLAKDGSSKVNDRSMVDFSRLTTGWPRRHHDLPRRGFHRRPSRAGRVSLHTSRGMSKLNTASKN
jgi:hypothetical protein